MHIYASWRQEEGLETRQVYTTPCGCAVIGVDLALLAFYIFNVRTTLSREVTRSQQSSFHVAMICNAVLWLC